MVICELGYRQLTFCIDGYSQSVLMCQLPVQTVESHPSGVAPGTPATSLVASLVRSRVAPLHITDRIRKRFLCSNAHTSHIEHIQQLLLCPL